MQIVKFGEKQNSQEMSTSATKKQVGDFGRERVRKSETLNPNQGSGKGKLEIKKQRKRVMRGSVAISVGKQGKSDRRFWRQKCK